MRSFQRTDKTTWSAFARFLTCYHQVQDRPCLYFQPSTSPRFSITDRQTESRCLPLAEILESKNYPLGQFPLDKSGTPSYQLSSRRFKVSCSVQSFWSRQFMSFSIKKSNFSKKSRIRFFNIANIFDTLLQWTFYRIWMKPSHPGRLRFVRSIPTRAWGLLFVMPSAIGMT
jgi:hypothetical protein